MKLDDLNKSQIVLLTLLVSFVTSIATGIVTVTLLDQAPKGVTQTINRVVERTIERVVPGEKVTVKEVPVIITEEQLIVDVINKASPAVVKIVDTTQTPAKVIGTGFFVSTGGWLVTDRQLLKDQTKYSVRLEDKQILPIELVQQDNALSLAVFKVFIPPANNGDRKGVITLKLATEPISIGQTVIAIGAAEEGSNTVSVGIVSGLSREGFSDSVASTTAMIRTNTVNTNNIGGPLLNIKGEIVGLSRGDGLALTAPPIIHFIDSLNK